MNELIMMQAAYIAYLAPSTGAERELVHYLLDNLPAKAKVDLFHALANAATTLREHQIIEAIK